MKARTVIPAKAGIYSKIKWTPTFVGVTALLLFITTPALAAPICYTAAEAEAEQGIRIHSELMVIGLNCQHKTPPGEKNYYYQYKEFTAKHGTLFAGYETTLINYYKRAGAPNPEGELNALRTRFANKTSQDVATMRPDLFCQYYTPRIQKAGVMDDSAIRQWASTFFAKHPVSQPICAGVTIKYR